LLRAELKEEKEAPITCLKCGQTYDKPSEAFYWEPRKNNYRKPCKKCLGKYNKTPEQKKRRYEYLKKYRENLKKQTSMRRITRRTPHRPQANP
jgi:hypothetical protein